MIIAPTGITFPLIFVLNQEGVGGLTGQTPTVALRNTLDNTYLDWVDGTFKASGWGLKYQPLSEGERGNYQHLLVQTGIPGIVQGMWLSAEFNLNGGSNLVGEAADLIYISGGDSTLDIALLRKGMTNRLEESGGSPGHLVLYDDDSVTPIKTWELRDENGGLVLSNIGQPSHRSKATP
jgi:hypothetical protein